MNCYVLYYVIFSILLLLICLFKYLKDSINVSYGADLLNRVYVQKYMNHVDVCQPISYLCIMAVSLAM
jgi:hypothetical protein